MGGSVLRNREILRLCLIMAGVTVVLSVGAFVLYPPAGAICFVCGAVLSAVYYRSTSKRYAKIAELSDYIRRMTAGEYSMDIRDNAEGELSILKNEIFALASRLTEQTVLLEVDRESLKNALSDISHQLKTPLTSLGIMAELLENGDLPEEKRREFMDNLKNGLERMEALVVALLKLAKLDANAVELKPERTSGERIISSAAEPLRTLLEIREQELIITAQDCELFCDPLWTAEALTNIVKNAAEHSEFGAAIEVSCSSNPIFAWIEVRDFGSGISSADLPHVFTRFYRCAGAAKDSVGVGLSMSRAILRKQSGDIEVASDERGTCFTLKFYNVAV